MNPRVRNRCLERHAELQCIDEYLMHGRRYAVGARRTDGHGRVFAACHGRSHVRGQALARFARIDITPVEFDLAEAVVQPQPRPRWHAPGPVPGRERDGTGAAVGVGGMGIVLKAIDPSLDRVVAVKVMAPRLANNEKARKRFAREAKAAAAVLHPNVIPIHSVKSFDLRPGYGYIRLSNFTGTTTDELEKALEKEETSYRLGAETAVYRNDALNVQEAMALKAKLR